MTAEPTVTLTVELDSTVATRGRLVPVEFVSATRPITHVNMGSGTRATVELAPGQYVCRAVLPDGATLERAVEVTLSQTAHVVLGEPARPPRAQPFQYSAEPNDFLWELTGTSIEHDAREDLVPPPFRTCWAALWTWAEGRWRPVPWPDRNAMEQGDEPFATLTVPLALSPHSLYAVQVGGRNIPVRVVLVPPGVAPALVLSVREKSRSRDGGLHVEVHTGDPAVDNLLDYLSSGLLEQADQLSGWIRDAESLLYGKVANQAGAAVGGYFLLRTRQYERMHEWPANFAAWYPWLPDAAVIRAAQLLAGPGPPPAAVRTLLEAAVAAGPPVYTQGLRHLYDALQMYGTELGPALLATIRPYADAVDWDGPLTTYRASDPNRPVLRARRGDPPANVRHAVLLTTSSGRTPVDHGTFARWRGEAGDPGGAAVRFEALRADLARVQGANHPDTLAARISIAYWRREAGDLAGAVAVLEELLADQLRVLGPDDPDTLTIRYNLAHWRREAGDLAGAAAGFEALLAYLARVQGPDHPNTLTTRHNLAYVLGEAGDLAGAVAALEGLLADRLRVLGPDDPDTLITRYNLADWRGEAGDPAGAAAGLEELVADVARVQGRDHPNTLTVRYTLARWRREAGDLAGAVAALEELLPHELRVLGPDHPETVRVRRNLARWRAEAEDRRPKSRMRVKIEIAFGADDIDELSSLVQWLIAEDVLPGRVNSSSTTATPPEAGRVADVLMVAITSARGLTALARSVRAWLVRRPSTFAVRITEPTGRSVEITAAGPAADVIAGQLAGRWDVG